MLLLVQIISCKTWKVLFVYFFIIGTSLPFCFSYIQGERSAAVAWLMLKVYEDWSREQDTS